MLQQRHEDAAPLYSAQRRPEQNFAAPSEQEITGESTLPVSDSRTDSDEVSGLKATESRLNSRAVIRLVDPTEEVVKSWLDLAQLPPAREPLQSPQHEVCGARWRTGVRHPGGAAAGGRRHGGALRGAIGAQPRHKLDATQGPTEAEDCLPFLRNSARQQRASQTLLRASAATAVAPETLLRAAESVGGEVGREQLLRADFGQQTGEA